MKQSLEKEKKNGFLCANKIIRQPKLAFSMLFQPYLFFFRLLFSTLMESETGKLRAEQ